MPKSTLNKIKDELIKEKERLEKELSQFAQKSKHGFRVFFKNFGSKEDDHVASVATMDNDISLEKNLEKSLVEVDKALKKVEQGQYGICESCGKKIKPQRLKIFSAATTCVNCGKTKRK